MLAYAPQVETSIAGDVVSTTRTRWRSQREQIDFLREVVDQYRCLYAIRARARDIVFRQYQCRPRDPLRHAIAIASWVQRNITYVAELPETFQTPTSTVAQGYGDCDDFSTLIGSLLEAVGIPCELVGMAWPEGGRGPSTFQHIYPRAILPGGRRVPLDATLPQPVEGLPDPVRLALSEGKRLTLYVR